MSNVSMLPTVAAAAQPAGTFTMGGFQPASQRFYNAVAGTIVQVLDTDAVQLGARGWLLLPGNGTTSQRPSAPTPGAMFVDSTASKTVIYDGSAWRDVTTGLTA